jgi:hypothetical protein
MTFKTWAQHKQKMQEADRKENIIIFVSCSIVITTIVLAFILS